MAMREDLYDFGQDEYIANECDKINCSIKSECRLAKRISNRNINRNTYYGFQCEGIVGLILERWEDYEAECGADEYDDYHAFVCEDYSEITGLSLPYENTASLKTIGISSLMHYLMNDFQASDKDAYFNEYLTAFMDKYNLIEHEVIEVEVDINDEMKTIIKTWAQTQEGS